MLSDDIDGDDGLDVVPAPVVPRRRGAYQKNVCKRMAPQLCSSWGVRLPHMLCGAESLALVKLFAASLIEWWQNMAHLFLAFVLGDEHLMAILKTYPNYTLLNFVKGFQRETFVGQLYGCFPACLTIRGPMKNYFGCKATVSST